MLSRLPIRNTLRYKNISRNIQHNLSRSLASQVPHNPEGQYPNYSQLLANLESYYKQYNPKGLNLTEKILFAHLRQNETLEPPKRGDTYLKLRPDRVAMQDASAQMAVLQFMLCGKKVTSVPSSIHCDHLIQAYQGAERDVASALVTEKEIFEFLESAAKRFGMQFWRPGSGIIHQIVLENYASPGGLMLGTDSHTPNAGGLGIMAIGVGGADAVDAMADIPWELKFPQVLGVRLTGELSGWTSPKDVILHLAGLLTVRGGTGYVIEYFGPGVKTLSCTGMATICNMGAEVGATTSLFPYHESMEKYLIATRRGDLAAICDGIKDKYLSADPAVHANPSDYYDKIIEVDLSKLEPHINGPFTPDLSHPLSKFKEIVQQNGWKDEVKAGLIGSCTNSSYQDMSRAASVAQQAIDQGLSIPKETRFLITPGSEQIRATVQRDGQIETLSQLGGQVLANACGPCIGQWKRTDLDDPKSPNAIVTSFNRNFRSRNDGSPNTLNFLAAPEIVTALTISGKLSFNPETDYIQKSDGTKVKLQPPSGDDLPRNGFELGNITFRPQQGLTPQTDYPINVNSSSDRLQILEPFAKWSGEELGNLKVLLKAEGKCTTDHISAAGPWLKYKGHLENIANNTLIGAKSANTQKVNEIKNFFTNEMDTIPNVAKDYLKRDQPWMVVTDHNYGEGSAREHAAMQPRYLGCQVILARSFARIHQTNLKKQGVLPLTFKNENDYNLINEGDVVFTKGVKELAPGSSISVIVHKQGNPEDSVEIEVEHSMSKDQIDWFKAGSALNFIADQNRN